MNNLLYNAKIFKQNYSRLPRIEETGYFMITFLERTEKNYNKYFSKFHLYGNDLTKAREFFF